MEVCLGVEMCLGVPGCAWVCLGVEGVHPATTWHRLTPGEEARGGIACIKACTRAGYSGL